VFSSCFSKVTIGHNPVLGGVRLRWGLLQLGELGALVRDLGKPRARPPRPAGAAGALAL
jgi:hypothetical protein